MLTDEDVEVLTGIAKALLYAIEKRNGEGVPIAYVRIGLALTGANPQQADVFLTMLVDGGHLRIVDGLVFRTRPETQTDNQYSGAM